MEQLMKFHIEKLNMGAGISYRGTMISLGISLNIWKCARAFSFRLHLLFWKFFIWKSFDRCSNCKVISKLIEDRDR